MTKKYVYFTQKKKLKTHSGDKIVLKITNDSKKVGNGYAKNNNADLRV